jgi:wee1-like protein kinase
MKPDNILLTSMCAKIGDFGLCHESPVPYNVDREGDRRYLSPETLSLDPLTSSSDVFSLGLIALEMALCIQLPENGPIWHQLRQGEFELVNNVAPPLSDLIKSMLHPTPSERPDCRALLKHPILDLFARRALSL